MVHLLARSRSPHVRTDRQHSTLTLGISALAVIGILVATSSVAAAQIPNFTTVNTNLQTTFAPLITTVRFIIMVVALVFAIWQGVQAARGAQGGSWINALLLLIVAGFAATPSTWVQLLGMQDVASNMNAWGL